MLNTLGGLIELAMTCVQNVETLRNSVTSENGTTETGLSALMTDYKLDPLIESTVLAAYECAVALR